MLVTSSCRVVGPFVFSFTSSCRVVESSVFSFRRSTEVILKEFTLMLGDHVCDPEWTCHGTLIHPRLHVLGLKSAQQNGSLVFCCCNNFFPKQLFLFRNNCYCSSNKKLFRQQKIVIGPYAIIWLTVTRVTSNICVMLQVTHVGAIYCAAETSIPHILSSFSLF